MIHVIEINDWKGPFSRQEQENALAALEEGQVLYFPSLPFTLEEREVGLLSPHYANPKSKNISYDSKSKRIGGAQGSEQELSSLEKMLERYAKKAQTLLDVLFPHYKENLERARTSYRPVEIVGRSSSYRKDDTRLHVDAFPSTPVQEKRILRVFTNINPNGQSRLWRLGEPFRKVVERFAPHCSRPFPGSRWLLEMLHVTKTQRTSYDHYMLKIHNAMKADESYQRTAEQIEFTFSPASSWIVFTDVTSHAAMQGQYAIEQTFYLPSKGMALPELAPLRVLENYFGRSLI